MDIMKFGELENKRDVGIRVLQRSVCGGPAIAMIYFFKLPFNNQGILLAFLIIVGGGAIADSLRLRRTKRMQNRVPESD